LTQFEGAASSVAPQSPLTGDEYLESLRDGREVWIYGERVKDVTTHPAFRNAARSVARLYDALHDPQYQDRLTAPTDTGNGGFTHPLFKVAHTREDLRASRDAVRVWSQLTFGWMGRTPDYKAALLGAVRFYQRAISPALPPRCRFYPSCSAYAAEAICADAAEDFRAWQAERTVAPAIGRLRASTEALRLASMLALLNCDCAWRSCAANMPTRAWALVRSASVAKFFCDSVCTRDMIRVASCRSAVMAAIAASAASARDCASS